MQTCGEHKTTQDKNSGIIYQIEMDHNRKQ